jgi:hypothetical protein
MRTAPPSGPKTKIEQKVLAFTSVGLYGNYVVLGGFNRWLHIVDIRNHKHPKLIHKVESYSPPTCITIKGRYAYIAEPERGLVVLNISNPYSAYITKTIDSPSPNNIDVAGGYAYLAADFRGMQIVDVDPTDSAKIVKTVDTEGCIIDVAHSDGYVYATDRYEGLRVFSVSNPEEAELVSTLELSGVPWWVMVQDNYAYVVSRAVGVYIIDISNPEEPTVTYLVELPDLKYDVAAAMQGDFIYAMGCKYKGSSKTVKGESAAILYIIDAKDRENPWVTNTVGMELRAKHMDLSGNYLYVADKENKLRVIDIDPPELADVVKTISHGNRISGNVAAAGGYTYLSTAAGLVVIDVEPVMLAHTVNTIETYGEVNVVMVDGNYAYVSDFSSGFRLIKLWDEVTV